MPVAVCFKFLSSEMAMPGKRVHKQRDARDSTSGRMLEIRGAFEAGGRRVR